MKKKFVHFHKSVAISIFAIVAIACTKTTSTDEIAGKQVNSAPDTNTKNSLKSGADATATEKITLTSSDSSASFAVLITAERDARIKEDKILAEKILALEAKLSDLSSSMNTELSKLAATSLETATQNATSIDNKLLTLEASVDTKIQESLATLKATLQAEAKQQLLTLETANAATKAELEKQLAALTQLTDEQSKAKIADLTKQLSDLSLQQSADKAELLTIINDGHAALKALLEQNSTTLQTKLDTLDTKLTTQITSLVEEKKVFEQTVADTYATKSELSVIKDYADTIVNITNVLGKQIDENDTETKKLLSDTILQIQTELTLKIDTVGLSLPGLSVDFTKYVTIYQIMILNLSAEFLSETNKLNSEITTVCGDLSSQKSNHIKGYLKNLTQKAANFEFYSQTIKKLLDNKFSAIDAKLNQEDEKVKEEKTKAQKLFAQAITEEQAERQKGHSNLNKVLFDLSECSKIVVQKQKLKKEKNVKKEIHGDDGEHDDDGSHGDDGEHDAQAEHK